MFGFGVEEVFEGELRGGLSDWEMEFSITLMAVVKLWKVEGKVEEGRGELV